jgi:hypothetical protein
VNLRAFWIADLGFRIGDGECVIGRPADLGKADGYRRGACSTRRRKDTGGSLLREDARQRVHTIRLRSRGGFDPPYTFLRNEPTVLAGEIPWIMRIVKYLCRLQRVFAGGFVLENEPTGGVF